MDLPTVVVTLAVVGCETAPANLLVRTFVPGLWNGRTMDWFGLSVKASLEASSLEVSGVSSWGVSF